MQKVSLVFLSIYLCLCICACKGQEQSENHLAKDSELSNISSLITPIDTIHAEGAPSNITRTVILDKNGSMWLATWDGVLQYNGSSFTNMTKDISTARFFSALQDSQGDFWFTSIGSGVFHYDSEWFKNFTTKDGLINDRVTNLYEDNHGVIWIGTEEGISCYNGETFKNITTEDGLSYNDVNAIVQDDRGLYWIGTRGAACIYDGNTFKELKNDDGLSFQNMRSVIKDRNGNIWLGGKDGLWRYDGKQFKNYSENFVGYIFEDSKGNIWTSSTTGNTNSWMLSFYQESDLKSGSTASRALKTDEGMFFGIAEDYLGNIWAGKLDGVYRYNGFAFEYFMD